MHRVQWSRGGTINAQGPVEPGGLAHRVQWSRALWSSLVVVGKEGGNGRGKPDRMSLKYKNKNKKEARLEVKIIAKQAIILILSSWLSYSMLCISLL